MSEDRKGSGGSDLAALKQELVSKLNIRSFYESRMLNNETLKFKSDGWSEHVHCPIHNDSGKPNLSVNEHSGGFKCFSCGKAGSVFDFWCWTNGQDPKVGFQDALLEIAKSVGVDIDAPRDIASKPIGSKTSQPKHFAPNVNKAAATDAERPPLPKADCEKFNKALNADHYKYLRFHRGFMDGTLKKYLIGWNSELKYKDKEGNWQSGKFTLPIPGKDGLIRNIRVHSPDAPSDYKMINTKGYGSPPRLFPLDELIRLDPKNLIYCEGEWDAILLNQYLEEAGILGLYLAVTNTAGCNTFEWEWLEYFSGRNIIFVFDVDSPGKTWAVTIASQYLLPSLSSGKIPSIKIISLPLDGSKQYKDVTDYFVKVGGKVEDLLKIIEATPEIKAGGVNNEDATIDAIQVSSFVECIKNREFIDRRVTVPLTISGQSTKIYHATRSMRVSGCPALKEDACCSAGVGLQIIPYGDTIFIESCMANRKAITSALQNIACTKGKPCTIEEVEKVVMEEYFGHQVIKRLTATENEDGRMVNSQELVTTSVYVLQPEDHIDVGPHDYIATGYVRSHPATRQATLFVEHLEEMEEDWRKFKVDDKSVRHLKLIQSFPNVKAILDELTTGVTQIYEANDILLTVLLTYLSPLWFPFNGKPLRGWINACILGDSGTGKSATYMRISDWLELGDLFSALSGTRTGLLYSIKQRGNEWYVQVGRYVLASGKIIAVDEAQEIPAEEIKTMAKGMDEGWLEVSRVASGGYQTQTRALFLMNPKGNKKISSYPYGCMAIAECFDPMFIRRLDICIFSSGKDDIRFYNKEFNHEEAKSLSITPEAFKSLVYWAWTRSVNDIDWTQEATKACLDKTVELAEVFGQTDDVPLVSPQDFRNNLARLSTAFAILSGSFTMDFSGVIVMPEHVEKMAKFVETVYSSTACNLKQHSKNSGKKKMLKDFDMIVETFEKLIDQAKCNPDKRWSDGQHFLQLIIMLQQQQKIRMRDLQQQLGVGIQWIQKHVAILQMYNLLEIVRGIYCTTHKFNKFMIRWQENDGIEEMIESVSEKLGKMAMIDPIPANEYGGYGQFGRDEVFDDYQDPLMGGTGGSYGQP